MKKLKTLLITSALFVGLGLSGCGNQGTTSSSVSTPNSTTSQSSSSAVDLEALAQQALAQVGIALSKYATQTGATANFSLITESKVTGDDGKEYAFTIAYSVAETYSASMGVSEDGQSVVVKTANSLLGGVDVQCKLHAEAKIDGKAYANTDFNVLVKAVAKYTIKLLYSAKDGDAVSFNGVVTGLYGADYGSVGNYYTIYVGDGDYGVTVFSAKLPDGANIGDYVNVSGTVSLYSNLYEIKSATLKAVAAADVPDVVLPTTLALNATNSPNIVADMASRQTTLTDGVVTSVSGSDGGNLTFQVKVGTVAYTVFENPSYAAAADYATFKQIRQAKDGTPGTVATLLQVNDTVTLTGFSSFYTTPQIVNAKVTAWTQGIEDTTKPTSITIADLTNKGWEANKKYSVQGYVTGYYTGIATPKNGLFIADGASGLDIYGFTGDCTAYTVGTCVTIVGAPSVYSGLIEFTADTITVTATADLTAKAAVTAEIAGISTGYSNSDISRPIHATGILKAAIVPVYGTTNATAALTIGNGESLNVYIGAKSKLVTQEVVTAWAGLAANTVVELTGFLANYKSNTTAWAAGLTSGLQVVSPTIVKTTAPTEGAVTPIAATQTIAAASALTTNAAAVDAIGFFQGSYATNVYNGVYVGDGESGIMAYKTQYLPLGTVVGTPLRVTGAVSMYNGLQEIDVSKGAVIALPKTAIATTIATPVALAISETVVPSASNLNRAMSLTDAVVKTVKTAVVAGKTDGTYVVTVGAVDVTVFVKKSGLAAADYTAFGTVVVGGKLSLNGFGGCYNTSYQIVNPSNVVFTPAA